MENTITVSAEVEVTDVLDEISDADLLQELTDRELAIVEVSNASREQLVNGLLDNMDVNIIQADEIREFLSKY